MGKLLKIAFIGGGVNSAVGYTHFAATQMDTRWSVIAGSFSRDPDINRRTALNWKIERYYDDWRVLINTEKDNIDAVAVLTPTPHHKEVLKELLELNIPVICEKALVDNTKDALDISNILKEKKGFLAVTYNYSGYPMVRELKAIIEEGVLGKIHRVQIEMPQEGFSRVLMDNEKPSPQKWRLSDKEIPSISLDLGVHLHHMIEFLTKQKPVSVLSEESTNGWFDGIVDDVSCMVKYTNNLNVQMWYSKSAIGCRNGLKVRVFGNKASAEWLQTTPEELYISYVNGGRSILDRGGDCKVANNDVYNRFKPGHPSGFIEAFANFYQDIASALLRHKEGKKRLSDSYVPGVTQSIEGLLFLECAHRSHIENRWVDIRFPDDKP